MVLAKHGVDLGHMTREQVADWTFYTAQALHVELAELLINFDWKRHRAPKGTWNVGEALNELVDLQKYVWNLWGFWGVTTSEAFVEVYTKKSQVVTERWEKDRDHVSNKL
jgi:hypothetical protein